MLVSALNMYNLNPDYYGLNKKLISELHNALYLWENSLYMTDVSAERERFSDSLMEIGVTRRLKPSNLEASIYRVSKTHQEEQELNADLTMS